MKPNYNGRYNFCLCEILQIFSPLPTKVFSKYDKCIKLERETSSDGSPDNSTSTNTF